MKSQAPKPQPVLGRSKVAPSNRLEAYRITSDTLAFVSPFYVVFRGFILGHAFSRRFLHFLRSNLSTGCLTGLWPTFWLKHAVVTCLHAIRRNARVQMCTADCDCLSWRSPGTGQALGQLYHTFRWKFLEPGQTSEISGLRNVLAQKHIWQPH